MTSVARAHVAMFGAAAVSDSAAVPVMAAGPTPGGATQQEAPLLPLQRMHWTAVREHLTRLPLLSLCFCCCYTAEKLYGVCQNCHSLSHSGYAET